MKNKFIKVSNNIYSDGQNHYVVHENSSSNSFPKSLEEYKKDPSKFPNIMPERTKIINNCVHKKVKIKKIGYINNLSQMPKIENPEDIVAQSPSFTITDDKIDNILKKTGYKLTRKIIEITLSNDKTKPNLKDLGITYYGKNFPEKRELVLNHYVIRSPSNTKDSITKDQQEYINLIQYNLNANPLDVVFIHEKQHAVNTIRQNILDNANIKKYGKKCPSTSINAGYNNIYEEIASRTAELLYYTDEYITNNKLPKQHNPILIDYFKTYKKRPSNEVLLNIDNIANFVTDYWCKKNRIFYIENEKSQVFIAMIKHSLEHPFNTKEDIKNHKDRYLSFFNFNINGKKYRLKKLPQISHPKISMFLEEFSKRANNVAELQKRTLEKADINETDIKKLRIFTNKKEKEASKKAINLLKLKQSKSFEK